MINSEKKIDLSKDMLEVPDDIRNEENKQVFLNKKNACNLIYLFRKQVNNIQNKERAAGVTVLDVETLVVVDNSVYLDHKAYLNSVNDIDIFQHIRTYYAHMLNGVNDKYQFSFENDPAIRINIKLMDVLIYTVNKLKILRWLFFKN